MTLRPRLATGLPIRCLQQCNSQAGSLYFTNSKKQVICNFLVMLFISLVLTICQYIGLQIPCSMIMIITLEVFFWLEYDENHLTGVFV